MSSDHDPTRPQKDMRPDSPLADLWRPPRPRQKSTVAIGDVAEQMQRAIDARLARNATDRAGYLGDCYDCQDTGYRTTTGAVCTCEAGNRASQTQRATDLAAMVAAMGIPRRHADSTFDTYPGDPASRQKVIDFLDQWDGVRGLYLWGNYGVGKTGLLVAALKKAAGVFVVSDDRNERRPGAIRFLTLPDLMNSLRAAYENNTYDNLIRIYQRVPLLALDDIGAERAKRDQDGSLSGSWVIEQLYIILGHRHEECLPTFFTSNLNMAELERIVTERVSWRIHEMCATMHLDGPNLRAWS